MKKLIKKLKVVIRVIHDIKPGWRYITESYQYQLQEMHYLRLGNKYHAKFIKTLSKEKINFVKSYTYLIKATSFIGMGIKFRKKGEEAYSNGLDYFKQFGFKYKQTNLIRKIEKIQNEMHKAS